MSFRPGPGTGSGAGLADRCEVIEGSFFEHVPAGHDAYLLSNILHDWNLEKKIHLIRAAYDALPPGGALVAIETLIDDARRENALGLLASASDASESPDPPSPRSASVIARGGAEASARPARSPPIMERNSSHTIFTT